MEERKNEPGTVVSSVDLFPLDHRGKYNILDPHPMQILINEQWKDRCIIVLDGQEYITDRAILKGVL